MKKRTIFKILPYFVIIIIFLANIFYYDNLRNKRCSLVLSSNYYCIVKQKIEVVKDHDRTELLCQSIGFDSIFILLPSVINPANTIFERINEGDTLIKKANSNVFAIMNTNKRDSFVFNCED